MMRIVETEGGFDLLLGDRLIVRHRADSPALFVGCGRPSIVMNKGNFDIGDRLDERIALRHARVSGQRIDLSADGGETLLTLTALALHPGGEREGPSEAGRERVVRAKGSEVPPATTLSPLAQARVALSPPGRETGYSLALAAAPGLNRFWLRTVAESHERVWGAGEQLSYFNLRGRHFPLWTSEPGVGRDKTTLLTFQADQLGNAGGDYWNTNYPQPTYVSERRYALHVDTTAYAAFDFREPDFHEIEAWEIPARIELFAADSFAGLVGQLSTRFGRQPQLPDWAISGAILGLKDGAESFTRLDAIVAAGATVTGLWCEDWVGLRVTSFGNRLFWDWTANEARYPGLRQKIAQLNDAGIRFLGYVNPYIAVDGSMYAEGAANGYFAMRLDSDDVYLVDFGEFECGIVDFTNPAAAAWFSDAVIGRNMLDYGLSGWMADFGEYLPTDVRLFDGTPGLLAHNAWPAIWAKVNADAVASRGKTGDAVFFMRAGWTGVQAHCPLLWAGDQSVDFSRHDGIGTVVTAALSSGLLGNAYHHSDLGGYTSLFGNVRTAELIMRWSELAAFTPVMRSHEGNRPAENLQIDGDPTVLAHFARFTRVHAALAPYVRELCAEAEATGLPLQRPLFLHFEADAGAYDVEMQYLYGPDLLVAPVVEPGVERATVYLPAGVDWVHLWSGDRHRGGAWVEVAAPIGAPPVFYRADSAYRELFEALPEL